MFPSLKTMKIGASALVLAASALACSLQSASAFERVNGQFYLVIANRQPVSTLDPAQKYDYSSRTLEQALYDGLVKYVGNPPKVEPWLAKDWTVSDDGLTWTFHLADNAKFHSGNPVTAEAVAYSFKRTLGLNKGPAWMLSDFLKPEGIKVVDEHTVQFKLERPYAAFLSFLPWWYIVDPAVVKEHEVNGDQGQAWLNEHAAGSGPYELSKFEQGKGYQLKLNKDYWKGFPYDTAKMGGVIIRLIRETSSQRASFLKGEADIVSELTVEEMQQVSHHKDVKVSEIPALTSFGMKFNTTNKYLSDLNMRKAIAYAFNYDGLLQIYNGRATLETSPFTDAIRGKVTIDNMPRQDLAKAKEYLAKTKYPKGGFDLEYVYVQGLEQERQAGLLLLDALKPLNIHVKITPLTWPNMVGRAADAKTAPDLMAAFVTPVSTDPDAVAIQYHPSSFGKYYGSHFLNDPALAKKIEEARRETEWNKRAPIYAEIQQDIVNDQPEIFGMMRERDYAYHTWVKGFQDSPIRMSSEIDLYPLHISK